MQYLKTGFAHCYWDVTTSDLFQWIRPKKYMNRYKCTHIQIDTHTHQAHTYVSSHLFIRIEICWVPSRKLFYPDTI